ncbi:MAG: prepilin-type N-terminal cleavage/methylation domain-containing protein [Candidatus Omnitrophica bacterium]|nr:prepilin-type N-terminal cleavage/methylation domain-containing protein [Candidatus Omnitrophota bacterium]
MRRGFTLLELVIVIVIIAILAALAIPQYMITTERARAAEGLLILDAVRNSQIRYYARWADYSDDGDKLDYSIESPRFFKDIYPVASGGYICMVNRNSVQYAYDMRYTLSIDADGNIVCSDNGCSVPICSKMGY